MLQAQGIADSTIMAITGHETHVMFHRYPHSDDRQHLSAVAGGSFKRDLRERPVTTFL